MGTALESVLHVVDLQEALPRLVAHRAVERVVDQVELHHGAAGLQHPLRLRVDDHALGRLRVARDLRAWHLVDVHHAEPALPRDGQGGMIAVVRHLRAGGLGRLDQVGPLGNLDLFAIDGELRHGR